MQPSCDITIGGEKFVLSDLLALAEIEPLMSAFCEAVGVASAIIDLDGRVLIAANWQPLCTEFHRVNEQSRRRCIESDTQLALELRQGEQFAIYHCKNGLVDCAAPVKVGGRHLANLFVGQFLLAPPDRDFFKNQARELGFAQDAYLAALDQIPVVSEKKLPAILRYLGELAKTVATISWGRLLSTRRFHGVQQALKMLTGPWAQLTGNEFYQTVCRYISEELGLEYAFVGELSDSGKEMRVLTGWSLGGAMSTMTYSLRDTPCANVMEGELCIYREQVRELFP